MIRVAAGFYPCCPDRATTFNVSVDGSPDIHRRECPSCENEYEVVTRYLGAGEVRCEWRPVTRIIGKPVATTHAVL